MIVREKISSLEIQIQKLENQKEELVEQASRENEAFHHSLERQNVKFSQEKQSLILKMELMTRDFSSLIERTEMAENALEKVKSL